MEDGNQFETRLLEALKSPDELKGFYDDFKHAAEGVAQRFRTGHLAQSESRRIGRTIANLSALAIHFESLLRGADSIVKTACVQYDHILAPSVSFVASKAQKQGEAERSPTHKLRQWFCQNISDPFPSKATKCHLVCIMQKEEISDSDNIGDVNNGEDAVEHMSYEQCSLWFINGRRRSGWTQFFRRYAASDKEQIKVLIDALQANNKEAAKKVLVSRPATASEDVNECFTAWKKVWQWVTQSYEDESSDWVDDVISQAKAESTRDASNKRKKQDKEEAATPSEPAPTKRRRVSTSPEDPEVCVAAPCGQPLPKGITDASKRMPSTRTASKERNASGESSLSSDAVSLFSNESMASSAPSSVGPSFTFPAGSQMHAGDHNSFISQWARLTQMQQQQQQQHPQAPLPESSTFAPMPPTWATMPHASVAQQRMPMPTTAPIFAAGLDATLLPACTSHMPQAVMSPLSEPSSGISSPEQQRN